MGKCCCLFSGLFPGCEYDVNMFNLNSNSYPKEEDPSSQELDHLNVVRLGRPLPAEELVFGVTLKLLRGSDRIRSDL